MKCGWRFPWFCVFLIFCAPLAGGEETPETGDEEFAKRAAELRQAAIESLAPHVMTPARQKASLGNWKTDIVTTVFFVGGRGGQKQSAWDPNWARNFGGADDPDPAARTKDFRPRGFVPLLNPFYCALPYNDLARGKTKPEARKVIPWFRAGVVSEGQSVCRDRWIAIRNRRNGRVAYAQWSDCGPHGGAQMDYVFGNDRPKPNRSGGAGMDVSPAVRDFLGLEDMSVTDWRFVEVRDVLPGPWRTYGKNNPFAQATRKDGTQTPSETAPVSSP